jgi:hypothetical protein
MLKNNANNLNGNLIKQNKTCHSQCDDQNHYYQNMSTWIKNPSQRRHIKASNLWIIKKSLLITNESHSMALTQHSCCLKF